MDELRIIENDGLIKVYETSKGEKVVNGRELHEGLGNKRQFADWVKQRLEEVDAVVNIDFVLISQNCETSSGGTVKKEYILKLDMAKEMAMLERNEKGKEYRKYLISVEEKYKQMQIDTKVLSPELQMFNHLFNSLAKQEIEMNKIKASADRAVEIASNVRDVFTHEFENWRDELNRLFNKIQKASNKSFSELRTETYKELESRAHCDLAKREGNLIGRLKEEGATKARLNAVNKLEVIEADPKLKEIYTQIIKEYAIRYVA